MDTNALAKRLGGKLSLPSLPEVVTRVQELVRSPDSSMSEIGEAIAMDPPLTARVLRIANSSYYSLRTAVMDINHASAILGLNTLNSVVLQVAVADLFREAGKGGMFDPKELWTHSVLTAQVAGALPPRLYRGFVASEAYVVGLFHDIGKFVMFDHLRKEFADVATLALEQGREQFELESELFGFNHAEVGELVTKRWGLPELVIRGVGDHHKTDLFDSGPGVVPVVALANHVATGVVETGKAQLKVPVPRKLGDCLELEDAELASICERALECYEEAKSSEDS